MNRSAPIRRAYSNLSNASDGSLNPLSVEELEELEEELDRRVSQGVATLSDFGRLAQIRSELARRSCAGRVGPTGD